MAYVIPPPLERWRQEGKEFREHGKSWLGEEGDRNDVNTVYSSMKFSKKKYPNGTFRLTATYYEFSITVTKRQREEPISIKEMHMTPKSP